MLNVVGNVLNDNDFILLFKAFQGVPNKNLNRKPFHVFNGLLTKNL